MNIEKAKKLKVGDSVRCPADHGNSAYCGKVTFIQPTLVNKNHVGEDYLWVHVKGPNHVSVWPSNRLS